MELTPEQLIDSVSRRSVFFRVTDFGHIRDEKGKCPVTREYEERGKPGSCSVERLDNMDAASYAMRMGMSGLAARDLVLAIDGDVSSSYRQFLRALLLERLVPNAS